MTVTQLQAALVPNLMPEGDWKKFWERARRELKSDHSIVMPATRTETIRVLESVTSREEEWFSRLAKELNLDNILEAVEDLASRNPAPTLEGKRRNLVQDRLAYAMHGALRDDPGMRARLLMAAQTLGLFETLGGRKTLDEFLGPVVIETTLRQLPARLNRKFLRFLAEFEGDRVVELLRRLMSRCELTILNEVSTYLMETGREDLVATALQECLCVPRSRHRDADLDFALPGEVGGLATRARAHHHAVYARSLGGGGQWQPAQGPRTSCGNASRNLNG
jgi:hypothetical protein